MTSTTPFHTPSNTSSISTSPQPTANTPSNTLTNAPRISNQILTIPHHTLTHFLTQIVHLDQTLFVHVTSITSTQALTLLTPTTTTDLAVTASLAGNLCTDFCLSMLPSNPTAYATSTTITATTPTSLSQAMSKRIALKLQLPQLLLSLDIPTPLLTNPSPNDQTALLALEKAIRDACSYTLSLQ